MDITKSIILFGLIISFFFGQLLRLNFFDISFPLIDVFIILFAVVNIFNHRHKLKIKKNYFLYFLWFSSISLAINLFVYHYPIAKPIFYFIRLASLLSLLIYPPQVNKYLRYFFVISIFANIIFGLIQYLIWPDFTYFNSLNWDPHLSRLVSTFFDPTFTGLIYTLFIIYLFLSKKNYSRILYYILLITSYIAIALTYSRSTFLALWFVSIFLSYKLKTKKILVITSIILLTTFIILPRPYGEGTKLERTSSIKAKIVNYQEGFLVFIKSPLIGHGYNNLSYVRNISDIKSHANSGFDGSLMTIATTSGIIGLLLFILGLNKAFQQSNLLKQSLLIAIFVHSLFANSLLYPWTLIFFILI